MDLIQKTYPEKLLLFPLCNDVLLPGSVIKIPLNDTLWGKFINEEIHLIGVIPFTESDPKEFKSGDIGTLATVLSITTSNLAVSSSYMLALGQQRFIVKNITPSQPLETADITIHVDSYDKIDEDSLGLLNKVKRALIPLIANTTLLHIKLSSHLKMALEKLPAPYLFDAFISVSPATFEDKLDILKTLDAKKRISKGLPFLTEFFGPIMSDKRRLKTPLPSSGMIRLVKVPASALKDIPDNEDRELSELNKRLQNAKLPDYAAKMVLKDMNRLKRINHFSPDHAVLRNYLEFVADLPWSISSEDAVDVIKAKEELDIEHYGMKKIKKRILEYLAVCQLKSDLRGPILCFVGPPGVGKTSIGRSIGRILNKNFQRISLGGVSNQSEIRGHRRTYIGALPGRILLALKQAGTNNPVILLDEIDKLGQGVMGSPKDALLEVLDPEQNINFTDHYLGMPFDLSRVTFIATANSTATLPLPLADRMEIIHISGYTQVEKFNIARQHLLPKQLVRHGLNENLLYLTDQAINSIIQDFTREAGVRNLDKKLAAICRTAALKIADSSTEKLPIHLDKDDLEEILGAPLYSDEDICGKPLRAGVSLGLSWTTAGGSVLIVEVSRLPGGSGQITLTGCLGKVMEESAKIAFNWVRSVGPKYGIVDEAGDILGESDLHIHFPAGAVSKEGPSAGITIACAVLSLFTGVPLVPQLAMTGELTLQGRVLPVGGLREKLSAANRFGIKKVIVPFKSKKYMNDIPESILASLEIILVENMSEVIETAFDGALVARPNSSDSILCSKL